MYKKYPAITSIGFLSPFLWNSYPPVLLIFVGTTSSISTAFWINPVENNIIHKMDGISARLTISTFILYKIQEPTPDFFISCAIMFFFFYLSNLESRKEWLSKSHIMMHLLAHLFAISSIHFF